MSEIAIAVEGVGKKYRLGANTEPYKTVRESLMGMATMPLRALSRLGRTTGAGEHGYRPEFWALKDVSFTVPKGEVLGVIGRNGAGKSTLLKLLSRITEPTEGQIRIRGRVASLLEVGTGFHPELTGRENVFLNGAVLGMTRAEVLRKFDEIVAFAEVEQFIDTPVKRYSSGMYLRLAFAVAAHLEPEILVVDEVLAVGDAAFQRKCLGKMGEVSNQGRTVLFVSHNMEAIQGLCHRCIWMDHGSLALDGPAAHVVQTYLAQQHSEVRAQYSRPDAPIGDKATLLEAQVLGADGVPGTQLRFREPFSIRMVWEHHAPLLGACYAIRAFNSHRRLVFGMNSINTTIDVQESGRHEVLCKVEHNALVPGDLYLSIGCHIRPHTNVHVVDPCISLSVVNVPYYEGDIFNIVGHPLLSLQTQWVTVR